VRLKNRLAGNKPNEVYAAEPEMETV